MWIEQAIYGEVNGGHALRATSGAQMLALQISSSLDLPDTAPLGVAWPPYISGFAHGDYYVFARTFEDLAATRSGMVLTHALIMHLADVVQCSDLNPLFGRLMTSSEQVMSLVGFELFPSDRVSDAEVNLTGVANALVHRAPGPAIILGADHFEAVITELWRHLWPEARATFGFRLSFGPADVVAQPVPVVVCTPIALAARWPPQKLVQMNAPVLESPGTGFITGTADSAPLLAFARKFGADVSRLSQLPLLERCHTLLSSERGIDDTLAGFRLLNALSPNPLLGPEAKKRLVDNIARQLPNATPQQILLTRNLSVAGFATISLIWDTIATWMAQWHFGSDHDLEMLSIIESTVSEAYAVPPWRQAIRAGFVTAVHADTQAVALSIWHWIKAKPELADLLIALLPTENSVELQLAKSAPKTLAPALGETLLQLTLTREWPLLHASLLAASMPPLEAVQRYLAISKAPISGAAFALRLATPVQLLACAVQLATRPVVDLAVQAILANPALLANAQFKGLGEQMVWDAALRASNALWNAPNQPFAVRDAVLDTLLDGNGNLYPPLLDSMAGTPLADLCEYSRSDLTWQRLDRSAALYIQATARGWLSRALNGRIPFVPRHQLSQVVLALPDLDARLAEPATTISNSLSIAVAIDDFPESRFASWLKVRFSRGEHFSYTDADSLGRLVMNRSWKRILTDIETRHKAQYSDMKPALVICSSMLSWYEKWTLGIFVPTADQKWESLAELAATLYPAGPSDEELWSRAGGNNADLPKYSTGRAMWRMVLGNVRKGRGPAPSKLLNAMREDYPANDQLRCLASDIDISGLKY